MIIGYHCTSKKNALGIFANGFKVGTFFALKRRDAVHHGQGQIVFDVEFPADYPRPGQWQFIVREVPVSAKRITRITRAITGNDAKIAFSLDEIKCLLKLAE